jgi:putative tricarboxylic transport membrane protein
LIVLARNKKLLILLSLTLVFIMVLTGCGNKSEVGENKGSVEGTTEGGAKAPSDDNWPVNPIRLVLPVAPGGLLDVGIRQMQPYLEKELGVPLVIDNRPGGQSLLMANMVAEAEPDGYTLGNLGMPHTEISFAMLDTDIGVDSYDYICVNQADIGIIRVHKDSEFQTFEDFIKYAVDHPGEISTSVSEMLAPHAFYMYQLGKLLGTEFTIVDFGGGSPARMALVGKHVDCSCTNVHGSLHVAEDTKVLAVCHDTNNWPELTDNAPTVNEVLEKLYGVTAPNMGAYYGFIAPKGLKEKYPERFEKIYKAFETVVHDPEYLEGLKELKEDTKVVWMNSEEMEELVRSNYEMYLELKDEYEGIHDTSK